MREVLVECLPEAGGIVEENAVFGTNLLHNGVKSMVVAVVDTREQMVLDLVVEATSEEKGGVAGVTEGMAS